MSGTRGARADLHALAARAAGALDGRALACAESFTAGLVTQAFAAVEGASEWLRGGVVAYQRGAKAHLLDVDPSLPLVSVPVAEQMARGVAARLDADVSIATTGAAGPDGLDGAPPGTVVMAVCVDGHVECLELHYAERDPATVVERAAADVIAMLCEQLERAPAGSSRESAGTPPQDIGDRR